MLFAASNAAFTSSVMDGGDANQFRCLLLVSVQITGRLHEYRVRVKDTVHWQYITPLTLCLITLNNSLWLTWGVHVCLIFSHKLDILFLLTRTLFTSQNLIIMMTLICAWHKNSLIKSVYIALHILFLSRFRAGAVYTGKQVKELLTSKANCGRRWDGSRTPQKTIKFV